MIARIWLPHKSLLLWKNCWNQFYIWKQNRSGYIKDWLHASLANPSSNRTEKRVIKKNRDDSSPQNRALYVATLLFWGGLALALRKFWHFLSLFQTIKWSRLGRIKTYEIPSDYIIHLPLINRIIFVQLPARSVWLKA